MAIENDGEGRRRVKAEIEIQASPGAIWKAIATGPGIASWFMGMETEFDEKVGGEVRTKMGDQMVPIAKLTAWDPPRHFATKGDNPFGPGSPPIGYEWTVEAKDGGTCTLRLVQTLFTEEDSWDSQLGDTENGWASFLHILRNYVERHDGQASGVVQAMGPVAGSKDEAFGRLTNALGLGSLERGATVQCDAEGVPPFSGEVEDVVLDGSNRVMIRLETPFPGTAWVGVGPINDNVTAMVSLYYYGEGSAEASARDGEQLTRWLQGHGPASSK